MRHDLDDGFGEKEKKKKERKKILFIFLHKNTGLKSNESPCKTNAVSYWAKLNLTEWGSSICANDLSSLVFSNPSNRNRFLHLVNLLLENVVGLPFVSTSSPLFKRIDLLYSLYAPYVVQDRSFPIDLGGCGGFDFWQGLRQTQFVDYVNQRVKSM
jgi:hypothetical protein